MNDLGNENTVTLDTFISGKLRGYSHGTLVGTEVSDRNKEKCTNFLSVSKR